MNVNVTGVNRERVRLLVEALRSGEFAQTNGVLGRDGRYCCLGVACVVAQRSGLDLRVERDDDGDLRFGSRENFEEDESYSLLPTSVQRWYGFDDNDPQLDPGDDYDGREDLDTAAEFNDAGEGFNWIADAFERTYLAEAEVEG